MTKNSDYEDIDLFSEDLFSNSMEELKDAAFEFLLLNPGSDRGDFQKGLIEQYPDTVVDALGCNPHEVYSELAELWEKEYTDPKTGLWMDFHEWAEAFSSDGAVGIYYYLVEAVNKLSKFNIKFP